MKDWNKIKKCLPVCGFLPTAALAVCTTISLSGYIAPILTVELAPEAMVVTTETTITDDRRNETSKKTATTTTAVRTISAVSETGSYKDGTYTGTGTGFAGPIQVQVVVKEGKIADISILSTTDDSPYIDSASALLKTIVSKQSTNVDTVSGATYSSVGLIEAVRDALQQAGGDPSVYSALPALSSSNGSSNTVAPTVQNITEPSAYRDGTYTGTGTGFAGPITVQVTVSNGNISDISILSTTDDSPYIDSASALLNTIVSKQSTNVDTVSGATYSSVGLIEAVRNALADATVTTAVTTTTTAPQNSDASEIVTSTLPYPDGVYLGTGEGYRSEITVAVSLKGGTIDTILVLSEDEDEPFFQKAQAVIDSVLKKQTTDVDVVSGATFSSEGILEAIHNALETASGGSETTSTVTEATESTTTATTTANGTGIVTTTVPAETTTDTETTTAISTSQQKYADGEYTAVVICYPDAAEDFDSYMLSVTIRIENDTIVEIKDIKGTGSDYNTENDWYIKRASNGTSKLEGIVSQILEQQKTDDIDAVSGATCTSDAILEAVSKALSEALQ